MYNCLLLTGGIVNGADCMGHAKVVNATVLEVECLPAVNTVELPVVEGTWEITLIANTRVTTGCYKVVLFQNQSVLFYEELPKADMSISRRQLVNTSLSVAECDNSFKAAFNTTRSSICCQFKYLEFLAVNPYNGNLILHQLDKIVIGKSQLHGKSATCSVTGSNGRAASSSFTITIPNGEPSHIACMRICVLW